MKVGSIEFGEIDAKNEVFKQNRSGKRIFANSFEIPPNIDIDSLLMGENVFIYGQKGCGKTALLLYLQDKAQQRGWSTDTILFRSGLSETERQEILAGEGFSVVTLTENGTIEYDFLFNWLWLIYSSILRRLDVSWVIEGVDIAKDLKKLLGVNDETRVTAFDNIKIKAINARAKLAFNAKYINGEIDADVKATKDAPKEKLAFEVIRICEAYFHKIKIHPSKRILLFFDELELFWNKPAQRDRDLKLIRDLLQAVSRTNRNLDSLGASMIVYASIRSEVLDEVNQDSPEISRDVEDFGVKVDWNVKTSSMQQPILKIVEAKIVNSEIEFEQIPTDDVWSAYFRENIFGRDARSYLLDTSMFKPRLIVMLLNYAKDLYKDADFFSSAAFEDSTTRFSGAVWREISEQLLQSYSQKQLQALRETLIGWKSMFTIDEFERRMSDLNVQSPGHSSGFASRSESKRILKALYESGAIGCRFRTDGPKSSMRDRWYFRDYYDCVFDKPFVIHESLRKHFQLSYD